METIQFFSHDQLRKAQFVFFIYLFFSLKETQVKIGYSIYAGFSLEYKT